MTKAALLVFGLFVSLQAYGQPKATLVKKIDVSSRFLRIDDIGNVYIVTLSNTIVKYSPDGDSITCYKNVLDGEIGNLDVTNTLRLLVYYPDQLKISVLNDLLALQAQFDMRSFSISSPTVVASSSDGYYWTYDPNNARILKFSDNGTISFQSNDLRQSLGIALSPSYIIEREKTLFISDTTNGLLAFDRFGSHLYTAPVTGLHYFQIVDGQLFFLRGDQLVRNILADFSEKVLPLPPVVHLPISFAIASGKLWVLTSSGLYLFKYTF